ncbi:MAG: phosphorylase [Chloroflexaceae bacterium]|nr:phosphorylase [Chloroflexaceae bacterium]
MNISPSANFLPGEGNLWQRVQAQTQHALNCGALQSLPTEHEFIEENGIAFLVRTLASLERKKQVKKQQDQSFNPFLPYEEDLFVGNLSATHLCLLNKYNVVDYHLLVVTREFEAQENWLTAADFAALWTVMAEIEGLGFYNGGRAAGASQSHKHLQVVPLPWVPGALDLPIAPLLGSLTRSNGIFRADFPFFHGIFPLHWHWTSAEAAGAALLATYQTLLVALGSSPLSPSPCQTGPYNLLVTREWMLLVPRSQEQYASISVNSLGFAGSLFVRNPQQLQQLKELGPLTLLKAVAIPW